MLLWMSGGVGVGGTSSTIPFDSEQVSFGEHLCTQWFCRPMEPLLLVTLVNDKLGLSCKHLRLVTTCIQLPVAYPLHATLRIRLETTRATGNVYEYITVKGYHRALYKDS